VASAAEIRLDRLEGELKTGAASSNMKKQGKGVLLPKGAADV
jgi:hypothetical protein